MNTKLQENTNKFMLELLNEANLKNNQDAINLITETISNSTIKPENKSVKEKEVVPNDKIIEETYEPEAYNNDDDENLLAEEENPFDLIPIPSKGLIYKKIKDKIAVSYLTAADEDLITSPNLYLDGRVIDILLRKKILDKTINPDLLCKADRDAIILWLRSTGYGSNFPVSVKDPVTDERFDTEVDLSEIKFNDFKLTPDKNGLFEFILPKSQSMVKFRFMTYADEKNYSKLLQKSNPKVKKHMLNEAKTSLAAIIENDEKIDVTLKEQIKQSINHIKTYIDSIPDDDNDYIKSVTYMLEKCIVEIDGNSDRTFIKNSISAMSAFDSMSLRKYINNNAPSLNFTVKVQRPESLGGGSFNTFLELDSTVFINIA